jgi:hypothetical protein
MKTNKSSTSAGAKLNSILKKHKVYEDLRPDHIKFLYEKFVWYANYAYSNYLFDDYPIGTELCFHRKDVYTLVEQVWKRRVYFRVFHKDVHGMNEIKEVALYCFWILKLQPFYVKTDDYMSRLNAKMALYILLIGTILYTKKMNARNIRGAIANKKAKASLLIVNTEDSVMDALFYSFRFRDWSKEALMDLCEGLILAPYKALADWKPDFGRVGSAKPGQWK